MALRRAGRLVLRVAQQEAGGAAAGDATPGIGKVAWGYIPVRARIGQTEWHTTLFPSRKDETYLIAIKSDVRKRERIVAGDAVRVAVRVL